MKAKPMLMLLIERDVRKNALATWDVFLVWKVLFSLVYLKQPHFGLIGTRRGPNQKKTIKDDFEHGSLPRLIIF